MDLSVLLSYEKSGTQSFEVPRMLYDDLVSLENYINKSKDKSESFSSQILNHINMTFG